MMRLSGLYAVSRNLETVARGKEAIQNSNVRTWNRGGMVDATLRRKGVRVFMLPLETAGKCGVVGLPLSPNPPYRSRKDQWQAVVQVRILPVP